MKAFVAVLASTQAVQLNGVSGETAKLISDAVGDVVKASQDPITVQSTAQHFHHYGYPVATPGTVIVPKPMPYPVAVQPAIAADAPAPHSSVMRAIADANEDAAMSKVNEQRSVADKLEKLEKQASINDAINDSVKKEEQRVIEAANKRMAEVHARKATMANEASAAIDAAATARSKAEATAAKEEAKAIAKAEKAAATQTVA